MAAPMKHGNTSTVCSYFTCWLACFQVEGHPSCLLSSFCTVKGAARFLFILLTPCCSAVAGRVFTARGLLGRACGSAAAGSIRALGFDCRRAPALQHSQEQNVHQGSSRGMPRAVPVVCETRESRHFSFRAC
jgi:hypothetical protein